MDPEIRFYFRRSKYFCVCVLCFRFMVLGTPHLKGHSNQLRVQENSLEGARAQPSDKAAE